MAADFAGKNVLENLECCICKENYNDPRKITCGHSFCLKCLHQHIVHTVKESKVRTFLCPLCKTDVVPLNSTEGCEKWAKAFPIHVMLQNCVKVIEMGKIPPPDYDKGVVDDNDIHVCSLHKKALDVYCLNHKMVVCDRCIWQEHNSTTCKIISVRETLSIKEEMIKSLTKKFKEQSKLLKSNSASFEQRESIFKDSLNVVLGRLDSMESEVNKMYRKCIENVQKLKEDAMELFKNIKSQGSSKSTYSSMLRNAKSVLNDVIESDDCIWILKTLKALEAQADDMDKEMDLNFSLGDTFQLELSESKEFRKMVKSDHSMGTIKAKKCSFDSVNRKDTMTESADELEQTGKCGRNSLVDRFKFKASIQDETECLLLGIACIQDHVVIADNENGKVKLFTSDGTFVQATSVMDCCGLCALPQTTDVVVSQPDTRQIVMLEINTRKTSSRRQSLTSSGSRRARSASRERFTHIRIKQQTNHSKAYSALCSLSSAKYAAASCDVSNPTVDILNVKGDVLRTLSNPTKGKILFKNPQALYHYTSGSLLIADSAMNRLTVLDATGNTAPSFINTNTRPSGVIIDDDSNVIVCQIDRNTVRCYSHSEDNYLLVKKKHRVKRPLALACNEQYLYVTEEYPSKNVIRFKINKEVDLSQVKTQITEVIF